ncbi:MAG: PAS domain S-box protein, partial [Chloroflexi bacterium]|nr:PAS domain S-box protein [Chloroflexota bacterium]
MKESASQHKLLPIIVGLLILGAIALTRIHSYLLFHSFAELFSIVIACGIFIITWNARRFLDNRYLLFIGIVYLFIGFLDLLHTLAYSGLGVFEGYGTNLPTQLWISARYLESLSFLGAFLMLRRSFQPYYVLFGYALVTAFLLGTIFYWEIFPDCYIEGTGLTEFKKVSEYVISAILFSAVAVLYVKRHEFETYVARLLGITFLTTIASELVFTLYTDPYSTANLIGHFLKIVSFTFVYMAIIDTGLTRPYSLLFRNLQKNRDALQKALGSVELRQTEVEALFRSSRAILDNQAFDDAARAIFDSCQNVIGATSGYVALLSKDGKENEVLFLESGGMPCTVDPLLPMPIRGLREQAYNERKTVYDNSFSSSEWTKFLPTGHVTLDNVLFAPLIVEGQAVGLLGLANKPGGFTDADERMASAFAELAAVALRNSRTMELLADSEQHFRSVAQTANDAIITADSKGNIFMWNRAAEIMFGYSADEVVGKPLTVLMPSEFHNRHQSGLDRVTSMGESRIIGKTVELRGVRKNSAEFPLELSLAMWNRGQDSFFTAII